jgi:hypothetical protein
MTAFLPNDVLLATPIFFLWLVATLIIAIVGITIWWYMRGVPWTLIKTKIKGGGGLAILARPDRVLAIKPAAIKGDSWAVENYGMFFTNKRTTYIMKGYPSPTAIFLTSMAFAQNPRVGKALEILHRKGYQSVEEVVQGTKDYVANYREKMLKQYLALWQARAKLKMEPVPEQLSEEDIAKLDEQGLLTAPNVSMANSKEAVTKVAIDPPLGYDGWSVGIDEILDWEKDYKTPQQVENLMKKTRLDSYSDATKGIPGGTKKGGGMNKAILVVMGVIIVVAVIALFLFKSGAFKSFGLG